MSGGALSWRDNVNLPNSIVTVSSGSITDPDNVKDNRLSRFAYWTGMKMGMQYIEVDFAFYFGGFTQNLQLTQVAAMIDCDYDFATDFAIELRDQSGAFLESVALAPPSGAPGEADNVNYFAVFETARPARYVRYYLKAYSGTFLRVSRLWAGAGIVARRGVDRGFSLRLADASAVNRQPGGSVKTYPFAKSRTLNLSMSHLDGTQAFGKGQASDPEGLTPNVHDLGTECGQSSDVVAVPTSAETHLAGALGVYGYISRGPKLSHMKGNQFKLDCSITTGL